ncbi:hypothetical protein [Marinilabilia rubra]|uniref:Outer membrane protein beta-barrel domain-containing protein n=1 Tax=Marinilabilia rubra TaxID=2162893 RepID=A0A2U2B679_9BACT|nr:hypothetical protein [Marinilabilia rubra]PWD98543.1 hypothetical protein DDZ16_14995 [Marinilabilia rubra]
MKTIFLIFCLSLFSYAKAQEANISDKKVGVSFTFAGKNDVINTEVLDGAGSTYGEGFFSIGLSYQRDMAKDWLKFKTGLEYSHQKIRSEPAFNPNIELRPTFSSFSLITIPATFKARFLKFLFVEGGGIMDVYTGPDAKIDSQAGIGFELGYGLQHEIKSGWTFTIHHYARMHSLLSFMGNGQQHVWENGIRLGIYMPFSVFPGKEN